MGALSYMILSNMHLNKNTIARKNAKFQYYRCSKLWHSEAIFKTVVLTLLTVINIIILIYTSIKFDRNKYNDISNLFGWILLLLYCGVLIDIEPSRCLKISLSILILINLVSIEGNILLVGITIDFLNLGVLWPVFKHGETNLYSEEYCEDEYILPLIESSKKLLNVYYELWRRNSYREIKSYNGLFVTRCVIMSCMYLCILLFNAIDKYTNFDKNKLTEMQNIIYLRSTGIIPKCESIDKISKISGINGIFIIQIMIITLVVLLKPILLKFVNLIMVLKNKYLSILASNEIGTEEIKQIVEFNSSDFNSQQNLDLESNKQNVFINRGTLLNCCVFFFSVFLFGMITFENQEFDITSRMFLIEQDKTIVICILLPLIGLLTEISMFRDWCWYFIFSWAIYYFNIWSDNSMVKSITSILSGVLFNISVILFVLNQIKNCSHNSKIQEYILTSYIFHKMCYFLGCKISKNVFSTQGNGIIKNIYLIITNIIIISNLYFLLYFSSTQETVSKQDENEIEWDVVY
ncbi:membrane associated with 10 transmembrane domains [Cryptosporidium sp. chipmunk genotype I]|uniref:membrane associated with 10 transmembrane domains n=1 Tax=Cryptosporidium sp. chipmunk genotype I TaxID=1280935 RepID=UPI003519E1C2|nr:membrane associated with 10 transmembrane domains [Cryptosporidium sp. chipmunk genotype I]